MVKPVTPDVALLAVVSVPAPESLVHTPVPTAGVVAANVAVVALHNVCVDHAVDET